MICNSYQKLVEDGTAEIFLAELLHAVMNDERYFHEGIDFVNRAKRDNVLSGVRFYPQKDGEFLNEEEVCQS
jgi:hypothetical protein